MTKRVGLNLLAVVSIIILYSTIGILYTFMFPSIPAYEAGRADPISFSILGIPFLFGYVLLITYVIVGYCMTYRPLFKKPFIISYWFFFAIFVTLYINNTLLPNTGKWSSFPSYFINYFGLYKAFFVNFNLDLSYSFARFGILQIMGSINLIGACTLGRITI